MLHVADAEAIAQITTRRNDFPKPIGMYSSIDLFGKNVVSTEGAFWRHHRKITSPPFTEKNNHLVSKQLGRMVSVAIRVTGHVSQIETALMLIKRDTCPRYPCS